MMKTTLQKVIELLDSQINVVENSKKGKDDKYKFGADAAITNLVMAKITFKSMIKEEREQIETAFVAGSERGTKDIPFNCEQYYYQTFGNMKDLQQRYGFVNRHRNGLPDKTTTMKVVTKDVDGEHIYLCEWKPFDKSQYSKDNMPSYGYLGTAKVIEGRYTGICFHAWDQNNSEFVWYAIV